MSLDLFEVPLNSRYSKLRHYHKGGPIDSSVYNEYHSFGFRSVNAFAGYARNGE